MQPERLQLQNIGVPHFSRGFQTFRRIGGALTRVVVVFSPPVELVVTNLRRRLHETSPSAHSSRRRKS